MNPDMSFSSQSSTQVCGTQEITFSQNLDLSLVDEKVWGRLLSLKRTTLVYNLVNEKHSFGRGNADHRFNEESFGEKVFNVLSKVHFIISRECKSPTESVIVLEDRSQNGTYVNSVLVGKNKKKLIKNNDEISLAHPKLKVFVFHDNVKNDAEEYPDNLNAKYVVMRNIGSGAYGEVRLAYSQDTLNRVAIKIMKKKIFSQAGVMMQLNHIAKIHNEIELLQSVNHPHVIQILDVIESDDRIFIVMELGEGGELFDRISSNGKLKEPVAKLYFYQLVQAVEHLHTLKITHRDIKPENILLEGDEEYTKIKLTDFGLSKLTNEASMMTTICGTKMYIAPELLHSDNPVYCNKVDIWSLGVVLYVCLSGHFPFAGEDDATKLTNIKQGRYNFKHPVWDDVSDLAKDLIQKMLITDPSKRLSAAGILQHSWMQDSRMKQHARRLLHPKKVIKSQNKRPLESSDCKSDIKTPKLMSGVEFNLNGMEI